MKRRVTYIVNREGHVAEDIIHQNEDGVQINVEAAKEERLATSLDEVVEGKNDRTVKQLASVLKQTHELLIRWASPYECEAMAPLSSRLTPGLHILWTPANRSSPDTLETGNICTALKTYFDEDLKCDQTQAFTTPPILSPRFSHTPNLQYYAPLPSLQHLIKAVTPLFCPATSSTEDQVICIQAITQQLNRACSLDVTYDAISSALTLSSYHAPQNGSSIYTDQPAAAAMELAVLTAGPSSDADSSHELTLTGELSNFPEPFKPTRFSFPSRHHKVGTAFITTFDQPTGLHPLLRVAFSKRPSPPLEHNSCRLHLALTIPSTVFLDKYAFRDQLFLQSHNLTALRSISGATDLEAPEWLVPAWGSSSLFEIADGVDGLTVPLHLRYMKPVEGGYRNIHIGPPQVFWACHAEEGTKFAVNPFERRGVGEGWFGERTGLWWLSPTSADGSGSEHGELMQQIRVPVLDTKAWTARWIDWASMALVLMGLTWIVSRLVRPPQKRREKVE